jgi:hypothetical protein
MYIAENDFMIRNNIENHNALFSVFNYLFSDDYLFSRPYIASKDSNIITNDAFIREYISNFDTLFISELKEYLENMRIRVTTYSSLLEDISDEFLRVDADLLMRRELLNLSEEIIVNIEDITLALIKETGYISAKKMSDFFFYPNIGTKWTPFLLVSIIKSSCNRLKIIENVSDYRYLNSIIVDSSLGIDNYDVLIYHVLKTESEYVSFKTKKEAEEFLKEKELITSDIPESLFQQGLITVSESGGLQIR